MPIRCEDHKNEVISKGVLPILTFFENLLRDDYELLINQNAGKMPLQIAVNLQFFQLPSILMRYSILPTMDAVQRVFNEELEYMIDYYTNFSLYFCIAFGLLISVCIILLTTFASKISINVFLFSLFKKSLKN